MKVDYLINTKEKSPVYLCAFRKMKLNGAQKYNAIDLIQIKIFSY